MKKLIKAETGIEFKSTTIHPNGTTEFFDINGDLLAFVKRDTKEFIIVS